MPERSDAPRPWDRLPRESGPAYTDFRAFLLLGPQRTVVEAAKQVGKSERQLRKQVRRHDWWERARAYDIATARSEDEETAQRLQTIHRQRQEFAEWAERAAWARLRRVVQHDPETGEAIFDPKFGVREALAVLQRTAELLPGDPAEAGGEGEGGDASGRLRGLSSRALEQLIAYVEENTQEADSNVETTAAERTVPDGEPEAGGAGDGM